MNKGQRVQVSVDLGVLIPEIASMTDDFPVDCSPVMTISKDTTVYDMRLTQYDTLRQRNLHSLQPEALQAIDGRNGIFDVESQRINLSSHGGDGQLRQGWTGR
jgi:hypothetical protein